MLVDAALFGDVARQVHEEGHDVRYYVEAESDADGFVPKTDDWRADVDWAEVIVVLDQADPDSPDDLRGRFRTRLYHADLPNPEASGLIEYDGAAATSTTLRTHLRQRRWNGCQNYPTSKAD